MSLAEDPTSADEWGATFASRRALYEDYSTRLEGLVSDLLRSAGIDVIQVESRTKTVASFVEKIQRKGSSEGDQLRVMTDLVGLRIITYYLEDVDRVGELVAREFDVDPANSVDKATELAADQFGYRSSHFVCGLKPARAQLTEWQAYSGLTSEIQVRTALQHAWAAVSHKVEYKQPDDAPGEVRRRLFRLSALFELADEQFSALRAATEEVNEVIREDVTSGDLDIPVNLSSLTAFLSLSDTAHKARERLAAIGVVFDDVGADRLKRDRSDLVAVLTRYGLKSLSQLDEFLRNEPIVDRAARALVSGGDKLETSFEDVLTQILIVDRDDSDEPGRPYYTVETVPHFRAARERLKETD